MAAKARRAGEWRRLVGEWVASGASATEFAAEHGLHPTTLTWWRWRFRRDADAHRALSFVEVVLDPPAATEFVVELGDAVRVRVPAGFDAAELRRLVAVLC